MQIEILADYQAISARAAQLVAGILAKKPNAVLCLASGHTPIGTFQELVKMAKAGDIDLSRCTFIGLDEWVGIAQEEAGSCRYFLDENLFKPLGTAESQLHFFNGLADDLAAECRKMDEVVARLGGLDLMLVGIGMNGHIALNEPGTPWDLYSHVSLLDEKTVQVGQKYFARQTALEQGITLGLKYLQEARLPLLMAAGENKAGIVQQALQGEITEALPASIFQTLPQGVALLDGGAAAMLK
jgi:glucosamine-6-phosphate isomerase